jgi:hypothetical protein
MIPRPVGAEVNRSVPPMTFIEFGLVRFSSWIPRAPSRRAKNDGARDPGRCPALICVGAFSFGRFAGVHLQVGGQAHRALIGRSFLAGCTLVYDGKRGSVLLAR